MISPQATRSPVLIPLAAEIDVTTCEQVHDQLLAPVTPTAGHAGVHLRRKGIRRAATGRPGNPRIRGGRFPWPVPGEPFQRFVHRD